ncbi:hypothetical protein B0H16DRAFT_1551541 [Mycena metata]|uniref:CCHC-type domain-containing protein n=1 Tax=Mycena metata TaxID=1033252 RepID=A0AAD7ISC0_9AGAR|nr:hypothetical protein B0H16DRAFT_1551541 [Mycena metata]
MGLPQGAVRHLDTMEPITPENWSQASRTFKMFFQGVHTPWVTVDDKSKPEAKVIDDGNDKEVMWLIFAKLAPEYQYLGDGITCAQDLWANCVSTFEASNMTSRMNARRDFVRTMQDPTKPINLYIAAIEDAVKRLDRLGAKPSDSEIKDTLLMNLHDSLATTRTTILTAELEPTLLAVKSQIRNAGPSVPLQTIKKEEDDEDENLLGSQALAARASARGPRTRAPRGVPSGGSNKKFHWCSATSHDQCRRCGLTGHVSDRCIHDMPSDVKDWVMAGPPGKCASAAYASDSSDGEAHLAAGGFNWNSDDNSGSDGEVDNYGYFSMKA